MNRCLVKFIAGELMVNNEAPHCEVNEVHGNTVENVVRAMPDEEEIFDLSELFKVFGDSTRMKILFALFEEKMCVCDLAEALGMTQSAISHQLKLLKQAKLVQFSRAGKQVIYELADDHVRTIIAVGKEHIEER